LSRLLSLGFGFPVYALEHEEKFLKKAEKFDNEAKLYFIKLLKKVIVGIN